MLGAGILVTLLAYFLFTKSPYFEPFKVWTESNIVLFTIFLFTIKVTGIVWPPLPGGIFVLGSIPLIGWFNAYLIDFAATLEDYQDASLLGTVIKERDQADNRKWYDKIIAYS